MNAHQDSAQKAPRWFCGLTVIAIVAAAVSAERSVPAAVWSRGCACSERGGVLAVAGSLALRLLIALSLGGPVARPRRLRLEKLNSQREAAK